MQSVTLSSVLLLPGILLFFGVLVYGAAFGNGVREHVLPKYRWTGVAIFALALVYGVMTVWKLMDPTLGVFYRATLTSRKVLFAHYAALGLPILLLAGVAAAEMWFKRYVREMA